VKDDFAESFKTERETASSRQCLAYWECERNIMQDSCNDMTSVIKKLAKDHEELRETASDLEDNRGIDVVFFYAAKFVQCSTCVVRCLLLSTECASSALE